MNDQKYISNKSYQVGEDGIVKSSPVIRIDVWKAIVIVFTAMLASAGGGLWGALAIANTIPFRVDAMEKSIEEMKTNFMPIDLSTEKWKNNDKQHEEIIRRLDVIQTTLGRLK